MIFLSYVSRLFRRVFSKKKRILISAQKNREYSEGIVSRGVLQFFEPTYLEDGVSLSLRDVEGLKNYKKEKKVLEEQKDYKKKIKEPLVRKISDFSGGVKRGLDWILENINPFEDFNLMEFCYSPKYNGFKTSRIKGGYSFRYGK